MIVRLESKGMEKKSKAWSVEPALFEPYLAIPLRCPPYRLDGLDRPEKDGKVFSHRKNQNQARLPPFDPHEISVSFKTCGLTYGFGGFECQARAAKEAEQAAGGNQKGEAGFGESGELSNYLAIRFSGSLNHPPKHT